jgi:thioredoxin 1
MPLTITKQNFETEVLNSGKTVLIDFWAPWCGPCRMLEPTIDEISRTAPEDVVVGKINIDEEPELASQYGVMSIPTLIVFKNGEVSSKAVGVRPKDAILDMLD